MRSYFTPLRYPGGKTKMLPLIDDIMKKNKLKSPFYVEPYAGGAGIAMHLLLTGKASSIAINDIDKKIYAFWYVVLNNTEELCHFIQNTNVTMDEWHKQHAILNSTAGEHDQLKLAFATFFLNRTNRSGILKGGVIGGKSQNGAYKMDCRYNKDNLVQRIQGIAAYKDKIKLFNLDAIEFLETIKPCLNQSSLVYLDPPYYVKGKGLYLNHYSHDDHESIAQYITAQDYNWIVSYDNVIEIKNLYKKNSSLEYNLNYSAQTIGKGKEVMFFSSTLHQP